MFANVIMKSWLLLVFVAVHCSVAKPAELKDKNQSVPDIRQSAFSLFRSDIYFSTDSTASTSTERQNHQALLSDVIPFSPLPILPIKGECPLNHQYLINSPSSLLHLSHQLDCIFHVSVPPVAIPLGPTVGYVLSIIGTTFYSAAVDELYDGHFFAQTTCDFGRTTVGLVQSRFAMTGPTLGWAYVINSSPGDGQGSRRSLEEAAKDIWTEEGELFDLREGDLVKDYRADVCNMCPIEVEAKWQTGKTTEEKVEDGRTSKNKGKIHGACTRGGYDGLFPFDISLTVYPFNRFVDVVRAVGRDEADGGLLLLGRTIFVPKEGQPGSTILYFLLKTFNPEILPGFSPSWTGTTGPVPLSFRREGAVGVIKQVVAASLGAGLGRKSSNDKQRQ
eukprot:GHVS01025102.1.p1 GENE.GHVS01025102.1~~GHVS01025102.1.p1  ORF type:complete len:390 (+),score=61.78 GHVS01025102.1:124-1293(+)